MVSNMPLKREPGSSMPVGERRLSPNHSWAPSNYVGIGGYSLLPLRETALPIPIAAHSIRPATPSPTSSPWLQQINGTISLPFPIGDHPRWMWQPLGLPFTARGRPPGIQSEGNSPMTLNQARGNGQREEQANGPSWRENTKARATVGPIALQATTATTPIRGCSCHGSICRENGRAGSRTTYT